MYRKLTVHRDVEIPMRDGVVLRADIYRPETDKHVPAILVRLPYNKDALVMQTYSIDAVRAAEAGFAVIYQDTRGRYRSDGEFYPFVCEGEDGYDTIEWVARQRWCSGRVGMSGASYFGATQWLAAVENPPHLKAIFPIVTTSEYYEGWTYQGGAFQLGFKLLWTLRDLASEDARRAAQRGEISAALVDEMLRSTDAMQDYYTLPLSDIALLKASGVGGYYFDWIAHSSFDEYWKRTAINRRYEQISVPAYNIGGWFDLFLHGTLENFTGMRAKGSTQAVREGQKLLIAPWAHGAFSGMYPEMNYGIFASAGVVDYTLTQIQYFDHYLNGADNGINEEPPVRLFVMGENRWRSENEWPLARAKCQKWYLHSRGNACASGGELSPAGPGDEPVDVYLYDPRDPAPTIGGPSFLPGVDIGANSGPRDQRELEKRPDVLVYTSDALTQPLEVTGPLKVILYASTSTPDTDFVAKLCDVYPDGASRILAEGILRARFREGFESPKPVKPGEVYEFKIDLVATSNVFLPGHRIRVDITSSSFPRFDRNLNSGAPLGSDAASDIQQAVQRVHHQGAYPSHIVLPVISIS